MKKLTLEDWRDEVATAESARSTFEDNGKRAWAAFLPDYTKYQERSRFIQNGGLFYSNVHTLLPHIFFNAPDAEVTRNIAKRDPITVKACEVLQRNLNYNAQEHDFEHALYLAVLDRLIVGRGQLWVEYKPTFGTELQPIMFDQAGAVYTPNGVPLDPSAGKIVDDGAGNYFLEYEIRQSELAVAKHVHWRRFLHSEGSEWDEIRWVSLDRYVTEAKAREIFGKTASSKLIYDRGAGEDEEVGPHQAKVRARIREIWCKDSGKRYYLTDSTESKFYEYEDVPISFRNFFPCPRPLLGTCDDDSILPFPDYFAYASHDRTYKILTNTAQQISRFIKVVAIYNKSLGLQFKKAMESDNGGAIPIENWASLTAQGGPMASNMEYLDVTPYAKALETLSGMIASVKAEVYEASGLSDLFRGINDPRATATAESIKEQRESTRIGHPAKEIQRFARDVLVLQSEVIAETFRPENIALAAGEDINQPEVQQAIQLLQDDRMRSFQVSVQTDSTLKSDRGKKKAEALEFLDVFTRSLQTLAQVQQIAPAMLEAYKSVFMMTVRSFDQSLPVEEELETKFDAMIQQLQQPPPPPPPDPVIELEKARLQLEREKFDFERSDKVADNVRQDADTQLDYLKESMQAPQLLGNMQPQPPPPPPPVMMPQPGGPPNA